MKIYLNRNRKKLIKILFCGAIIVFYLNWNFNTPIELKYQQEEDFKQSGIFKGDKFKEEIILKSYCSCRPNVKIHKHNDLENFYKKDNYYIYFDLNKNSRGELRDQFDLEKEKIFVNPRFTCDLDKVLTHGPKKKVLGYSYYGKNKGYVELIELISKQAKELYPDWIIRVYYDNSIDKSVICDFECKYDNVYFCNVNKVPFKDQDGIDFFTPKENDAFKINLENDLSYVHGMMWYI